MRALVLTYYLLLRSLCRAKPHLRRCLNRCRRCRIFLLVDPRNAGRKDLRCPFGCQEAHRRQQSTQRSVAYYRGPEGREKKRIQNSKRRGPARRVDPSQVKSRPLLADRPPPWPKPLVEHVRVVVSMIEDRTLSRGEILEMLAEVLRQQGMGRRRKIDHAVSWLHENPP